MAKDFAGERAFTAEQVREAKSHLGEPYWNLEVSEHEDAIGAMLDAFAERLEQDNAYADGKPFIAFTATAAYAVIPPDAADSLREEGRREERARPLELLQTDS